ncbi:DUF982 domain-containing protein [Mesorhizobium sp. AR10]|uniref:DUF982 domain-containing protein n=1 Tax=Mesorhizobium sp. AR10 TaxID=2865839 RepID=UPI00215E96CD|nr:DUF982 domain-containing protein [Mesorhizobium sp. AR10]UVK41753.1 DUF982 domain-containing protein [Mesorhizobium sp. AR10]
MAVSSLNEARIALEGQWPNKEEPKFKDAARLVSGAVEGSCKPGAAFAAFKAAARQQGLIQAVGLNARKPDRPRRRAATRAPVTKTRADQE